MKILFAMRDDGDMTEPMNLMLLSALAQKQGHTTRMMVLEGRSIKDTLSEFNPDIMAFSCITGNQNTYITAAAEAKRLKPSIITVFGGPHFTYFPGEIMRHEDVMDLICVGEGDDAWPEILTSLEAGQPLDNLPNVVTRNNTGRVFETPAPSQPANPKQISLKIISDTSSSCETEKHYDAYTLKKGVIHPRKVDLDSLPFLDRGLVYDSTAFKNRFKRTHMASRGCPFRCAYCFEPQINDLYKGLGNVRQFYTVDRFLDELEYVKKNWDTRYFKFYDDVFIPFPNPAEIAWHQEFCSKYPRRIGLPFHLLTRCDVVMRLLRKHHINVIRDWKKAGLASLTMSIESGNPFIHDHVIVRDMSHQDVQEAYKLARTEGVYTFPNTIVAIPAPILPREDDPDFEQKIKRVGEELGMLRKINRTKTDISEVEKLVQNWAPNDHQNHQRRKLTLQLLEMFGLRYDNLTTNIESVMFTLECQPGFAEFLTLFPYPGTKATEWCETRGDFDGNFEKLHASYQTETPLTCYGEYERKVIHNLTLLGTFLTLFWGSWHWPMRALARPMTFICINGLSKITHPWARKVYTWVYTISKAYMHITRIYPIHYSFKEKLHFYKEMIRLDFWKNWKQRRKMRSRKLSLGGPV